MKKPKEAAWRGSGDCARCVHTHKCRDACDAHKCREMELEAAKIKKILLMDMVGKSGFE